MKNPFRKSAFLIIGFALVGFSALAQMPIVPDPMRGVPNPMQGVSDPTPMARAQFYPEIPSAPLPPNVNDPVAAIMPVLPRVGRPDLNAYNYAAANPTNLRDPSGLSPNITSSFLEPPVSNHQSSTCTPSNNQMAGGPGMSKQDCIDHCSDTTLPTGNFGWNFFRCMNECMGTNSYR